MHPRFFSLLLLATIVSSQAFGQSKTSANRSDETAIRALLAAQTKAWNNGDLVNFMEGYLPSDSLLFVGKSGPTYGFHNTLNNYKKGYPDTAAMGKLTFTLLSLSPIEKKHYRVLGKWELKRSKGDVSGYFTLLFEKIKGKWFVIQDHSS
jgi:ketosteroid isomerase-like protein